MPILWARNRPLDADDCGWEGRKGQTTGQDGFSNLIDFRTFLHASTVLLFFFLKTSSNQISLNMGLKRRGSAFHVCLCGRGSEEDGACDSSCQSWAEPFLSSPPPPGKSQDLCASPLRFCTDRQVVEWDYLSVPYRVIQCSSQKPKRKMLMYLMTMRADMREAGIS